MPVIAYGWCTSHTVHVRWFGGINYCGLKIYNDFLLSSAELGRAPPSLGRARPSIGRTLAELGRAPPNLGRARPSIGTSAELGRSSAELGRSSAELGRASAEPRPSSAELGRGVKKNQSWEILIIKSDN